MDQAELCSLCEKLGHPHYRGRQVAEWLYRKGAREVSQMTNLPGALREELGECCGVTRSEVVKESRAKDGTRKFLLRLGDDETIESVLLPYLNRTSVCVSAQVGCRVGCVFCATAELSLIHI